MFTVLVLAISAGGSVQACSVEHFSTQAAAESFQPIVIGAEAQAVVLPGHLTIDEALEEWLD